MTDKMTTDELARELALKVAATLDIYHHNTVLVDDGEWDDEEAAELIHPAILAALESERQARERAEGLGQAIRQFAVGIGICRADAAPSESELRMLLGDAAAELARLRGVERLRPLDEWHEDCGPALWWRFPIEEAPYCGGPLDCDWPGYHTHWSPIPTVDADALTAPATPDAASQSHPNSSQIRANDAADTQAESKED